MFTCRPGIIASGMKDSWHLIVAAINNLYSAFEHTYPLCHLVKTGIDDPITDDSVFNEMVFIIW